MRIAILIAIIFSHSFVYGGETPAFKAHRVAHAGGGINGKTYTNSYQALDFNLERGFLYFELDFSFTRDDQLVCIHDWHQSFPGRTQSFARFWGLAKEEKPTLAVFQDWAKHRAEYENCTLDGLATWMGDHPQAMIVTDAKDDNLEALSLIRKKLPDAKTRVIPQIYQPEHFYLVKKLGFEAIIWTLYRYNGSNEDVLRAVDTFAPPFAVTMPLDRAKSGLPEKLGRKQIPTYIHTVNSPADAELFLNKLNLTEIYTDFLAPPKSVPLGPDNDNG